MEHDENEAIKSIAIMAAEAFLNLLCITYPPNCNNEISITYKSFMDNESGNVIMYIKITHRKFILRVSKHAEK